MVYHIRFPNPRQAKLPQSERFHQNNITPRSNSDLSKSSVAGVGRLSETADTAANLYNACSYRKRNDNNCHCEERSDVAISIKIFGICLNTQKNEGKNAEFN